MLRLQVAELHKGAGWGSEDHVLASLPLMSNISAHLSTSGYVSPVLRDRLRRNQARGRFPAEGGVE